jgi:hypothetical protein
MESDEEFLKRVQSLFGKRLSAADARRLQRLQSAPRPRTSTILKPGALTPRSKLRRVFKLR